MSKPNKQKSLYIGLGLCAIILISFVVVGFIKYFENNTQEEICHKMSGHMNDFLALNSISQTSSKHLHDGKLVLIDTNSSDLHYLYKSKIGSSQKYNGLLALDPNEVKTLVYIEELEPVYMMTYGSGIHVRYTSEPDPLYSLFKRNDNRVDVYSINSKVRIIDISTRTLIATAIFRGLEKETMPERISEFWKEGENSYKVVPGSSLGVSWARVLFDKDKKPYGITFSTMNSDKIWDWIVSLWAQKKSSGATGQT